MRNITHISKIMLNLATRHTRNIYDLFRFSNNNGWSQKQFCTNNTSVFLVCRNDQLIFHFTNMRHTRQLQQLIYGALLLTFKVSYNG